LDRGYDARTHGAAALANCETQSGFTRDRRDQLDLHLDVVARHDHLDAFRQLDGTRHVRRAEVELRAIVREERRVASALFFREDVHFGFELLVRLDGARLGEHLTTLDVVAIDAAEQHADVVAGDADVQQFAEHFDTGDDRLARLFRKTDDLDFFADLDLTALDAARADRTAAGDREDVFDRHEERLVGLAHRLGDVL